MASNSAPPKTRDRFPIGPPRRYQVRLAKAIACRWGATTATARLHGTRPAPGQPPEPELGASCVIQQLTAARQHQMARKPLLATVLVAPPYLRCDISRRRNAAPRPHNNTQHARRKDGAVTKAAEKVPIRLPNTVLVTSRSARAFNSAVGSHVCRRAAWRRHVLRRSGRSGVGR